MDLREYNTAARKLKDYSTERDDLGRRLESIQAAFWKVHMNTLRVEVLLDTTIRALRLKLNGYEKTGELAKSGSGGKNGRGNRPEHAIMPRPGGTGRPAAEKSRPKAARQLPGEARRSRASRAKSARPI